MGMVIREFAFDSENSAGIFTVHLGRSRLLRRNEYLEGMLRLAPQFGQARDIRVPNRRARKKPCGFLGRGFHALGATEEASVARKVS